MYEPGVVVRRASERDLDDVAELMIRFYRFNEEFDPAWTLGEEDPDKVKGILAEYMERGDLILVAEVEGRVVGFLRAGIVENKLLERSRIGLLRELYVKPEYRRRGIARKLIEEASEELKRRGAQLIAAEFPGLNVVAEDFYRKLGFRLYTSVFVREV